MLSVPFRTRATHVVHFWPVAVAYVQDQIANDAGEVRERLRRLADKAGQRVCGYDSHRRTPLARLTHRRRQASQLRLAPSEGIISRKIMRTLELILIIRDPFRGKLRSCSRRSREANHCALACP